MSAALGVIHEEPADTPHYFSNISSLSAPLTYAVTVRHAAVVANVSKFNHYRPTAPF